MIVITGGAYQGKKEFAKKTFGLLDSDFISGKAEMDAAVISGYKAVSDYEYVIKHNIEKGIDPQKEYEIIKQSNPDIIIIGSEVGSGIIPVEKNECIFRETAGRIMCRAAADSENVYKVICGIGVKIK